eukprot:gene9683-biopygen13636
MAVGPAARAPSANRACTARALRADWAGPLMNMRGHTKGSCSRKRTFPSGAIALPIPPCRPTLAHPAWAITAVRQPPARCDHGHVPAASPSPPPCRHAAHMFAHMPHTHICIRSRHRAAMGETIGRFPNPGASTWVPVHPAVPLAPARAPRAAGVVRPHAEDEEGDPSEVDRDGGADGAAGEDGADALRERLPYKVPGVEQRDVDEGVPASRPLPRAPAQNPCIRFVLFGTEKDCSMSLPGRLQLS